MRCVFSTRPSGPRKSSPAAVRGEVFESEQSIFGRTTGSTVNGLRAEARGATLRTVVTSLEAKSNHGRIVVTYSRSYNDFLIHIQLNIPDRISTATACVPKKVAAMTSNNHELPHVFHELGWSLRKPNKLGTPSFPRGVEGGEDSVFAS